MKIKHAAVALYLAVFIPQGLCQTEVTEHAVPTSGGVKVKVITGETMGKTPSGASAEISGKNKSEEKTRFWISFKKLFRDHMRTVE